MADIPEKTINLGPNDSVCLGKLLDDTQHAGQAPAKTISLDLAQSGPGNCLVFTPLAALRPQGDDALPRFTNQTSRYGLEQAQAGMDHTGDSPSPGIRPYIGLDNALHPGQPLAFDSDLRQLSFADDKPAMPRSNLDNLYSNGRIYPVLVFGVNMSF